MHETVALMARLEQMAAQPDPSEQRTVFALALVKVFVANLYGRLGIGRSNLLETSAKCFADHTLWELRGRILAAELNTLPSFRPVLTAARHRIEMARRVLASRLARENGDLAVGKIEATDTPGLAINRRDSLASA